MISRRNLFKLGAKAAIAATVAPVLAKVSMAGEPARIDVATYRYWTSREAVASSQKLEAAMQQLWAECVRPSSGDGEYVAVVIYGSP